MFGIPPRFHGAALSGLDPEVFGFVLDYMETKTLSGALKAGRGLLISGPPGVGKTHAIVAATKKYAQRARNPSSYQFETCPDLLDKYRSIPHTSLDEFRGQPWDRTFETVKWLVINDMGKENRGGKFHEQHVSKLGRLLRKRNEQMLVTHITTNLPIESKPGVKETFQSVYGESLVSLCTESMEWWEVWGEDRRIRLDP